MPINNILISNIYYMLAYAFNSLNFGSIKDMGNEKFDNLHELFAEIIIRIMRRQLKRGLPKEYQNDCEELSNLRGKIDLQTSIRNMTLVRRRLFCQFDEFTEDTSANRLIKCAITNLLKQSDISTDRKRYLKFLYISLSHIKDIQYRPIPPQSRGGAEYIMLVNLCGFLLDGLLINTYGRYKMRDWLNDKAICTLYEHFLLGYFKRHHSEFDPKAAYINWDMESKPPDMPIMKSDVYLTYGSKTLIIDAKFYSKTMTVHLGKKTFHSHNLYQIYSYVKNADKMQSSNVSGILLYAKTDEDITPDSDIIIGGNLISVKTLDLSQNFNTITTQLEGIAKILIVSAQ